MKSLSKGKIWLLAAGQMGWAMLSGLISNWLVYFYQPDETAQAAPLYLYAHSMGGCIGTLYLEKHQGIFRRAVLNAPMYGLNSGGVPDFAARLLCRAAEQDLFLSRVKHGRKVTVRSRHEISRSVNGTLEPYLAEIFEFFRERG